ncbi:hypothetical protein M758_8G175700 [Ceratodon purpureus]|nr:hypothetical protein M758_8G175700 [Ceratodon purpureus]
MGIGGERGNRWAKWGKVEAEARWPSSSRRDQGLARFNHQPDLDLDIWIWIWIGIAQPQSCCRSSAFAKLRLPLRTKPATQAPIPAHTTPSTSCKAHEFRHTQFLATFLKCRPLGRKWRVSVRRGTLVRELCRVETCPNSGIQLTIR